MQNLDSIFRSMKRIAPTGDYASSSRAEILATRQHAPRVTLAAFFKTAGVVAMASLAFFGGVSVVRVAFPEASQFAAKGAVNSQALAAEAQTIDTQLALADVQHQAVAESNKGSVSSNAANIAKSAAGASSDGSVDRALTALSE